MDDFNTHTEDDAPDRPEPAAAEVPADFVPLRLVLQPGGFTIELWQAEVLLGRHSRADVRLPLPDVSRRHCRFAFAAGRWTVSDLGSLNGTFVNGRRVEEALLCHRDTIRMGGFLFEIQLQPGDPTVQLRSGQEGVVGSILRRIADALPDDHTPHRRAS
jgi:predicted component of type VI protein secretion system